MKKILRTTLMVCLLLCMAFGLAACGDKPALNEAEWKYATSQNRLKNSSYSLESECYNAEDKTTKVFSLEEEVKLNEQNISVVKTRKNYANGTPDNTFNEYYSLEYGTWTYGSLINGTNIYSKSTLETNRVEPFVLIMKIFGDTPGQFIGSKYSEIEKKGSSYTYKDEDMELSFTFTDGIKNWDTWYCDVDKISFKWTRLINGVDYYEEGQVRFYDINSTEFTIPNEVHMNLFCQDYVVRDKIQTLYHTSTSNEYLYSHYMEEDDYSIVSIRANTNGISPVIYFGGQMSTNILALPYTVRKGVENVDGTEQNVFYLDVQSDVISDIKCYCNRQESRVFLSDLGNYENDTKNWPITFYTGEGLYHLSTTVSYKVNGVEYKASGTNQISWVLNSNASTVNDTPVCMFYNFEYDLKNTDSLTNHLPNPYTKVVRTNEHIFALNYDHYTRVVPFVETIYTTENDRLEYGKVFYATKLYVVDITNLEKNNDDYFIYEYENETRNAPNVSVKISNNDVKICAKGNGGSELDVNVILDRTEGIVSYYRIDD